MLRHFCIERRKEKRRERKSKARPWWHPLTLFCLLAIQPNEQVPDREKSFSDKVCSAEDDAQSGPWPSCANTLPTHKHPTPESLVRGKAEHPVEDNTPILKDGLHMVAPFQHSPQPGDQGKGTFLLCSLPPANPHQVPYTKTIGKPSRALAIRTADPGSTEAQGWL